MTTGNKPSIDSLWLATRRSMLSKEVKQAVFEQEQVLVYPGFQSFKVQDWNKFEKHEENSVSWKMYFWMLVWLYPVEQVWAESRKQDWSLLISELIGLLHHVSLEKKEAPDMFWDDHAISYRSSVLVYLYWNLSEEVLSSEIKKELEEIIEIHRAKLMGFVGLERWQGNNHSLLHLIALLNISCNGPSSLQGKDEIKELVLSLERAIDRLVDIESGIASEQSFAYQAMDMIFIDMALVFLRANKLSYDEKIDSLIERMLSFTYFLLVGNQALPAIGDTPYQDKKKSDIDLIAKKLNKTELISELSRRSSAEAKNSPSFLRLVLHNKNKDGFAALRLKSKEESKNDSLIVFRFAQARLSHGHYDYLSLWFTRGGTPLVTDSGGPYQGRSTLRDEYFVQNFGHSTVLVDKKKYTKGAEYLSSGYVEKFFYVTARIRNNNGAQHMRTLVVNEDACLIVIDSMISQDKEDHKYTLRYQFAPNLKLCSSGVGKVEVFDKESRLLDSVQIKATGNCDLKVINVGDVTEELALVTEKLGESKQVPLILAEAYSASFSFVTSFASSDYNCELENIGDSLQVQVTKEKKKYFTLKLDREGVVKQIL